MKLIFLYGMPAVGKLTVAQELSRMTGYKLFHNHMAVDLLLSVFEFGSAPFVELREEIWLSVFEQACRHRVPGLIFTFAPEPSVRAGFVERTLDTVSRGGGEVEFVAVTCALEELRRRIESPSRLQYQKLSSLCLFEELYAKGDLDIAAMPRPRLIVDTGRCSAMKAAAEICDALGLGRVAEVAGFEEGQGPVNRL